MATIALTLNELLDLITQNVAIPDIISEIQVIGDGIVLTTRQGIGFCVFIQSFDDGWLEIMVEGKGLIGKMITHTVGTKLLDILAPDLLAKGKAQTQGQSIWIDIRELLKDIHGVTVKNVHIEKGHLIIRVNIREDCEAKTDGEGCVG